MHIMLVSTAFSKEACFAARRSAAGAKRPKTKGGPNPADVFIIPQRFR